MSGSGRRVDLPPPPSSSSSKPRSASDRVSVFSRLGTKSGAKSSAPQDRSSLVTPGSLCRHRIETGHCPYGSKCKKVGSHSLVSPSKRSEVSSKERPPNSGKRHGSPALDTDWMNWDEENLDFDDELMLEKKRQLLERELAKQQLNEDDKGGSSAMSAIAKKMKLTLAQAGNVASIKKISQPPPAPSTQVKRSSSSSSSSSSSDSDSSSSSDSSSDSSSEPSKQKTKKPAKRPTDEKLKRRDKSGADRKGTKSMSSKASKKTTQKSAVAGSKLSRHRDEKRKTKKVKKSVKGSASKRSHSPSKAKSAKRSSSGNNSKDDRVQDSKMSAAASNPVRKCSERDKFGFYHAVAPQSSSSAQAIEGKDRNWKPKKRRSSVSPARADVAAKRHKKPVVKSAKRSLSSDRRRSSHSPHVVPKRRTPPPSKNFPRSGSAGRDRDHRDGPRGKYEQRHGRNESGGGQSRGRDNFEQPDRRAIDDKERRYERHFNKDRSPATSTTGRSHEMSPGSRPATQGRRMKDSAGKGVFSGVNAIRIEPRSLEHRDKYPLQQQQHHRLSKDRDRSPRDRLMPSDRISRERERSPRERLLPPESHQREGYSRERSPREKYLPQNRFSRERERIPGSGGPPRDRGERPDYPDRASPFERLGHHPMPHKHWEERDYSRGGMPDRERDDVAKIRSLKAEILLNRKPENVKLENKEEKLDSVSTVRDRDVPPSPPSNNVSADDFKDVDELAEGQLRSDDFEGRATEEFSDLEIGDSDDEILNKINPNDNEEDGLLQTSNEVADDDDIGVDDDETEEGEVGNIDSRSSSRKSLLNEASKSDLLEGISDEDLDISDDDEAKSKAKIADALGVDWAQLMTASKIDNVATAGQVTDVRKRWTAVAIFNRIGISKRILGEEKFKEVVDNINQNVEDDKKLELLDDVAGFHVRLRHYRKKRRNLFAGSGMNGALTSLRDVQIRRLLCNLTDEAPIEVPFTEKSATEYFRRGSRVSTSI